MSCPEGSFRGVWDFSREHRSKIHSTNTIERVNGEIKRRSDVGLFPNEVQLYS